MALKEGKMFMVCVEIEIFFLILGNDAKLYPDY